LNKPQETAKDEEKFSDQGKGTRKDFPNKELAQDPVSEYFYTPGSLSNIFSQGDHPIPQTMEVLTWNKKSIVKRTHIKRKKTLDNGVLCTSKEVIIDTKKYNMIQLYSVGLTISHNSFDKEITE
jgi:hypothetical protein